MIEEQYRDQTLIFQVKRMEGDQAKLVDIAVAPTLFRTWGMRMTMGPIVSVSNFQPAFAKTLQVGDTIVSLNGNTNFDPLQLPDLVHQITRLGKPAKLGIKRGDKTFDLEITPANIVNRGTWNESAPLGNTPMGFPALGISYSVSSTVAAVTPDSPAAKQGVKPGDVVKKMAYVNKEPKFDDKFEMDDRISWSYVFFRMQEFPPTTEYTITIADKAGAERTLEKMTTVPIPDWYYYSRGLLLEPEQRIRVAENIWDAIVIGGRESYRFVGRIYLNLYSLLRGSISVKLLNGPLGLAEMTYRVAKIGLIDLLHLLAVISINLAIVNFLPIPVLDGGHMVLLIAEKIRGKKLSETWEVIITYIGLAIVLTLMLGTVFLDLTKYAWFKSLFGW